jgi:hypothetical protein
MTNPVVVLSGEKIELACTLDAAIRLSALQAQNPVAGSGPRTLGLRASGGDLEAIAVAISLFSKRPLQEIIRDVFEDGVSKHSIPVSEFYLRLSNGGKPLVQDDGDSEVESEGGSPP